MPAEWEEGSVCPISKKGDRLDCSNYRKITLPNIFHKIFSIILFDQLEVYTSRFTRIYLCGFQKRKITTNYLHTVKKLLKKTKEYNINKYHISINFKAAYDSVYWYFKTALINGLFIDFKILTFILNL